VQAGQSAKVEQMAESPFKHETRLRVRYAETDQMGVVYYANYYIWMEVGRVEFVRALGMEYKTLEDREGLFLAVIESNCRYLRPARYDQDITVETSVGEITHRLLEFQYEIRDTASGEVLAKGITKHMWLNREWRPARLPEPYLETLHKAAHV
jgi:acyl-CoA thioester hydrolase